ncbi:gas vesicle structural protein GvpA [Streptomyces smyrnaeus]|uniref:Gas vesicle protein A n=1 Tax=Streptomyces smyrnaeus TaxID=1387713 RepID=A0ABS3Y261_9ACTN|nr:MULTISPECIES: gas vesicle structural protein GvpA [Streptomyces]MBO8201749.1 gas vesicle structural protein GvpA [Streptomyces smyrnaeus]MBQ0866257.1 gas vesicle structural protein GvpA [Streptomyces sp. RK75]MBQ1121373.1 gas vesicle structural protein GvpA [Streptomyces sp. B15]
MTVAPAQQQGGGTGNLYDVLELVLDRGLVIDAFVRVSLVGIEILKIDVRVVVASVDTYLKFAEACNRLDLESGRNKSPGLPDVVGQVTESGAQGKTKGALSGAAQTVSDAFQQARDESQEGGTRRRTTTRKKEERE